MQVCDISLATQMQMLLAEHYHSHTLKLHGNERKETAKGIPPCPQMGRPFQSRKTEEHMKVFCIVARIWGVSHHLPQEMVVGYHNFFSRLVPTLHRAF